MGGGVMRRVCRVLVNNDDLLKGLPLPIGAELVKIVPAMDYDWGNGFCCHWLYLRHPDLEEIGKGEVVPERHIVVEEIEREIGPHTIIKQRKATFA